MTANNLNENLVLYRMEQSKETLEAAKALANASLSPLSIVNRSYYAMFYAVLALLATINKGSSKHSGVISLFDIHFIKTNKLPREFGRVLHKTFNLRNKTDYSQLEPLGLEQALQTLADADALLTALQNI